MAELKDRLKADRVAAMKARDELAKNTLGMALTAIQLEEVAGEVARELTDDEVLRVLTREAAKRKDSAEAYAAGNRPELAEKELAEAAILHAYLPAALSEAELYDSHQPRWFAIQLVISDRPINLDMMPRLEAFAEHQLYSLVAKHETGTWHALRLGFFADERSAETLCEHLRTYFSEPATVRVSVARGSGGGASSTSASSVSRTPKLLMAEPNSTGVCLPARKASRSKGSDAPWSSSISCRARAKSSPNRSA